MRLHHPTHRRHECDYWYYWIDGKQSYPSGDVLARTRGGAKQEIRIRHPGCVINHVLRESEYHTD